MRIENDGALEWVTEYGPRFTVNGDCISVLETPDQFYATIMDEIAHCKKRISISTLYLGTGDKEQGIVHNIQNALESKPSLQARILLDYNRGLRGQSNSCTMLRPLLNNDRIQVYLYHTPDLRGFLRDILPGRWSEIIGVQHMKIYVFDNDVIISGANLSETYFTNRQDRYILLRDCEPLADYLIEVQNTISSVSFRYTNTEGVVLADPNAVHPYLSKGVEYHEMLSERMIKVIEAGRKRKDRGKRDDDTVIFPLIQIGNIGIQDNHQVHRRLLATQDSGSFHMASGYFNLVEDYKNLIARRSQLPFSVLAASPKANGFYGGSGISGFIPAMYVHILRSFMKLLGKYGREDHVTNLEYERDGWTFHGKGMWWTPNGDNQPSMTLVGSPNYGYRSVERDTELELMIVTANQRLRNQFDKERKSLFSWAHPVTMKTFQSQDHLVPFWVKFVSRYIRSFF